MNNILEMIKNEKVEWKKLGDVCEDKFWIMPATPKFSNDYEIPYITGKNIKDGSIDFDNVKYISGESYEKLIKNRAIEENDVLISMIGTIGDIAFVKDNRKFYGQNLYLLRLNNNIVLNKYFFHFFSQNKIKKGLISKKNSSSQGYIRAGHLESLEIPIPSMETQERIVKILDTMVDHFTQLEAELEAELEARNKQYEYYRDKLLSEEYLNKLTKKFGGEVEYLELGDIGEFFGGLSSKNKNDFINGNERFITYKNVFNNISTNICPEDMVKIDSGEKQRVLQCGDIIFTGSSEIEEESGYSSVITEYVSHPLYLNSFCFFLRLNNKDILIPDFSKFLFRSKNIRKQIIKTASGVTRFNVSKVLMKKIIIPIPPIPVQEHIVSVLDNFKKIVSDINEGLPKEIELRQKQYEYYRERLLDFKRDDNE